ncbi:hypothetical protein HNP84_006425 [Thermocatellispora tengchongensis]|uniref:Uncharacterized protein n=1 Tax=Thermocatellispora tengchongensis TaxID=1073253 RepID=A0A840P5S7_9ACTN|nr:hypothetical protein [Thermocatellispora tengchongensis]MBB5136674.1 hypothetical protein [Thermocatellispora tengchongensis]
MPSFTIQDVARRSGHRRHRIEVLAQQALWDARERGGVAAEAEAVQRLVGVVARMEVLG